MKTGKPERMDRRTSVVDERLAMESVAAHQATCGCHPGSACSLGPDCFGVKFEGAPFAAKDSSGQPWHIDPLCKARPEAKA